MIFKLDYFDMYLSTKETLNVKNIEKISLSNIEHIGKPYDKNNFEHLKKKIFFKWFFSNSENTNSFLKRSKKLLKKLDIELSEKEKEIISNIEPREFTERRSTKTIEVPYIGLDNEYKETLDKNAFFFYHDLRLYKKRKFLLELKFRGEIYFTSKEIVTYDRKNNIINDIVIYKDIKSVTLKSYSIDLHMTNNSYVYLRYKDNELIYISLKRSILNTKNNVNFFDETKNKKT